MEDASSASEPKATKKVVKPLSKKKLEKHLAEAENRGVIYLSRIPPFLKPNKLRDLLSGMGTEVLRIYLAPEDSKSRAGRLRNGGNKKKDYSEGWVEFEDKRRAKRIASSLNNTPIGGANRSFYAHDLWNIKYLHKFKWTHLTEKIAYEARVRRDKMQAELSQAKKESSFYLQKVEQAKAIDAMEERKRARQASSGGSGSGVSGTEATTASKKRARSELAAESAGRENATREDGAGGSDGLRQVRRHFKQRRVVGRGAPSERPADERVLANLLSSAPAS
eukprot:CAMPEP_0174720512 /NCGR_PEP_ID=MMETSP1094-20130205/33707_1 /TAXON_ID=156173 /ORGANISM="Chrysochromulina brevifilum, Strain UTEX LB 985" /LENGTH=278 /DNA_ID=CAMNT_0015921003 /DNA_START=39 /DNA_END=875 /DNA_ORIENTATION=+